MLIKFHEVSMHDFVGLLTHEQTYKQTNKQTDKQTNKQMRF